MDCSNLKHALHVVCLYSLALTVVWLNLSRKYSAYHPDEPKSQSRFEEVLHYILETTQYLVLLPLPQMLFNFLGLTLFNLFPSEVVVSNKGNSPISSLKIPYLCFRVVTRGLFPELVVENISKNLITCDQAGLTNLIFEIVTDKDINPPEHPKIRQLVVPTEYRTSTGALFKARALQYALEPGVSPIQNGDYVVHLDEETLLTKDVVNGIINFALDGTHAFGQGLIVYARSGIVNYMTTFADSFRVADDLGKLRFQFKAFHRPLFGWKGSFVVTKIEAEKDVSFDWGPDGSIAEDCFFSMVAFAKGYTFDFIEGPMLERSPFTLGDFLRQRKRWLQGIWLVVHSTKIPTRVKILLTMSLYTWIMLPITLLSNVLAFIYAHPAPIWLDAIGAYCFSVSLYMYLIGGMKSFDLKDKNIFLILLYSILQLSSVFINIVIENLAAIWGIFGKKHHFYIVDKNINSKMEPDV